MIERPVKNGGRSRFSLLFPAGEGRAGATEWSRLALMMLLAFCRCAASADLRVKDTGKQQLSVANGSPSLPAFSPPLVL